jgi:flagellin-like protein
MMNYRKLRKNVKAISPVISVLLMIAVAVAASLVTYAWVMGYLNFTTNKVGKAISIQSVSADGHVYVQNVGDSTLTLSKVYVNGLEPAGATVPSTALAKGDTATVNANTAFVPNTSYTIRVTATDGSFAEITKTFP